jgi:hypothetical protein
VELLDVGLRGQVTRALNGLLTRRRRTRRTFEANDEHRSVEITFP